MTKGIRTTVYHYSLSGQLIAETQTDGTIIKEYAHLRGELIIQWQGNQTHYIHTDHLGTPRLITDTTGTKVWEISTRPFGEDATTTGSATLNLRFPGQYVDDETGLNYNWNRYYDASIGRYVTPDPIGLGRGVNTYSYVKNNPEISLDPFGLWILWPPGIGNGNIGPGFTPQKEGCSGLADVDLFNSNRCSRDCCNQHDTCYATYLCNDSSWRGPIPSQCQICNLVVVMCIIDAFIDEDCESCEN